MNSPCFGADGIPVIADPDRRRGAATALAQYPQTTLFILDDGMQHRRVRRDFELVIVHAAEPFRIRPRLSARIASRTPRRPAPCRCRTYHPCRRSRSRRHRRDHFHDPIAQQSRSDLPMRSRDCRRFRRQKIFRVLRNRQPRELFPAARHSRWNLSRHREFDDHHEYTKADLDQINDAARTAHAELLITTAKDWVKLERFADKLALPIVRAELSLRFRPGDEELLLSAIRERLRV